MGRCTNQAHIQKLQEVEACESYISLSNHMASLHPVKHLKKKKKIIKRDLEEKLNVLSHYVPRESRLEADATENLSIQQ